ncbi:MAG: hypothetical protein K1X53_08460 [Candidatus Sumerlaeaceae bacterium]|nr:hypothetical protein [Candidatus Sumerlaeaceae bacterium]
MRRLTGLMFLVAMWTVHAAGFDPSTLPQVGYHPSGLAYYDTPFFANALHTGGHWMEYQPGGPWGNDIQASGNPQFDNNGFPKYLNPGLNLRAICFGLHVGYGDRPSTWPGRYKFAQGRVVLMWKGDADVRLNSGGAFQAGQSNGPATGRLVDGRRVYVFPSNGSVQFVEVHDINTSSPITDMKVWLSDPANPSGASLENQLYHPTFLARLADADWGFIRFMNFLDTNSSPVRDWADRRPPTHCFMSGVLNTRAPATGFSGNRTTGVAFEHLVALCNASHKDLWINVPHLATDDFVRKLAKLIRFGSDGTNPYDGVTSNPVYAPLASDLRVYVEYSNEIWSNGNSFAQGNWAQDQATSIGISKAQFNGRRFCEVWSTFQDVFGGSSRLVRVAAVWTGLSSYTQPFLQEINAYGPTLNPPTEPDVLAATTYFGNGIQDWAHDKAQAQASTGDPWFYTGQYFDAGGGNMHPVSKVPTDSYWVGADLSRQCDEALGEWMKRLLSGDARAGGGPDATGFTGGFEYWLRQLAQTAFATPKPLIAYEGGPSIYTDYMDWGDSRDDGITAFLEAMNRRPGIADVYRVHLNMAKSKGLRTHVIFTDVSKWGKYGQWGHLESLDQPPTSSPKYQFILDWMQEQQSIRSIDDPAGSVPGFATPYTLAVCRVGEPYSADIVTSGGDGQRVASVIGSYLADGLLATTVTGDASRLRVSGTATTGTPCYVMARVLDADGDPGWRTFSIKCVGGPGTLVESDFTGSNPGQHYPWTAYYVKAAAAGYSGWGRGAGIIQQNGDDAVTWSVNAPANESSATLALALADSEYLTVTVQPPSTGTLNLRAKEVQFTVRRIDYHAPRRYAVFTSVGGFADGQQVFVSDRSQSSDNLEYTFRLPDSPQYENLTGPVEVRIVGFQGQYGGHRTSLTHFKLFGDVVQTQARIVVWDRL